MNFSISSETNPIQTKIVIKPPNIRVVTRLMLKIVRAPLPTVSSLREFAEAVINKKNKIRSCRTLSFIVSRNVFFAKLIILLFNLLFAGTLIKVLAHELQHKPLDRA